MAAGDRRVRVHLDDVAGRLEPVDEPCPGEARVIRVRRRPGVAAELGLIRRLVDTVQYYATRRRAGCGLDQRELLNGSQYQPSVAPCSAASVAWAVIVEPSFVTLVGLLDATCSVLLVASGGTLTVTW